MCNKIQQSIKDFIEVFGDVITYKDICKLLEVEPKTGNTRQKHWNEFKRYCKLEPVSRSKQRVVEIYDTPVEKVDGRKGNGQHPNSQKALEEYGHQRTIPAQYFYSVLGYVYADCTEQVIIVGINELRTQVGIGNNSTAKLMYNKQDLKQDLDLDWEVINAVFANLYNSMNNKISCTGIQLDKLLVFTDGTKRLATKQEKELIQQAEELAIVGTRFKEYSEIYTNGNKSERELVKHHKTKHLKQLIPNYCSDSSCFVIQRSVLDTTVDYETAKQLKQQINTLFYEHEVARVTKRFDDELAKIKNRKCYGSIRKKCLLHKQQALQLLETTLKLAD